MTAEECLQHDWLRRKKPILQRVSSMDVAKDNLKVFVERWNEHPNSPYVFEISDGDVELLKGDTGSESSHSLIADSPSPCGSIASSIENDNIFVESSKEDLLRPQSLLQVNTDHFRRASDSTCFVKHQDITERNNLAEEIRKLSDKLFRLSNLDTTTFTNGSSDELLQPPDLPKDHPQSPACGVPWRRTKFKININTSRDVPMSCRNIYKRSFEEKCTISRQSSVDANGTKDLLLKLLDNWEGPRGPVSRAGGARHGSVSSEWSEDDSLGQRTISSLNSFFQNRATNKKITQFHFNKS